jgi:hypothetical protein
LSDFLRENVMRYHLSLRSRFVLIAVLVLLVGALALPALAQDGPPLPGTEVIGGLDAPRGIAFDADGNLLIAVAGSGGEMEMIIMGPEGEAPAMLGMTGRIVSVAPDGTASDHIAGFPSYAMPSETLGLYRAIPQGDSLWVIYSGAGASTSGAFWQDSVVELDATTFSVKRIINLNNFETVNDPDGNGYDSNVADIAWGADGTLYIVDAGANALLSWTADTGLATVTAWPDNPVPDSIEIADNGDIYIGFLGAGLAPGGAKIERWSGGELAETFAGFTAISDILLDGDKLYAVELLNFGPEGPGAGRVIMVDSMGATPIAEGLLAPFALAMGPDGALYVSHGTIAFFPGMTGGVVKLDQ